MTGQPSGPNDLAALQRQIAELQAQLAAMQQAALTGTVSGTGAVAQGGGDALGERAVQTGDNSGDINTGTRIETAGGAFVAGPVVTRGGHVIGRDYVEHLTQIVQVGEDPQEAQSVIALYLHALVADLAGLRLGEIDLGAQETGREPLKLADVYVPLYTTFAIPKGRRLGRWLSPVPLIENVVQIEPNANRPVSALEALAHHRELTLLGKPGSGKSTFGARVLLALAQTWQGHRDQLADLGETWTHGGLFPIRVVLRRFAERLPPGDGPARAGDLWDFIAHDLRAAGYGMSERTIDYAQRIARNGGALMLLDGLDECGGGVNQGRVLAAVRELMGSAGPKCRFLLTARPYAWPGGPDPRQGVYALADLDDARIEQFVRGWYRALVERHWLSPGEGEYKMTDLLAARQRPDLAPLARNPLLLTLMATLHANRGRLPDDRADLYDESVDLLMLRWNRQIGTDRALLQALAIPSLKLSDLREVLEELAFEVHKDAASGERLPAIADGTADIGEGRLLRAFRPLLNDSLDKAAIVVEYIENRAGLLIGQGEKDGERQFAFPHRTFQEFLAACHLAARDDFPAECVRLAHAAPNHWQVALALAARVAKAERGASAADELIGGVSVAERRQRRPPGPADWTCARLAGQQLQEIGLGAIRKGERTRAIADRVTGWLADSLPVHPDEGGLPAVRRARAGDVLARLGDPRFDPERFHLPADEELGFVHIPADPGFRIGTRKAHAKRVSEIVGYGIGQNEINDESTTTPDFYIARYPVTVAQLRAFVEAKGFDLGNADALRDPDNRPARWVSWPEAVAYCTWLNAMLAGSPALAGTQPAHLVREQGWQVALPSELEWEKAARGGLADAVFPWGDTPGPDRANYRESEVGDSSAVGCFPANGVGLYDLVGNLFEWTRSRNAPYPYRSDDGREAMEPGGNEWLVVRGGSWDYHRDFARCAFCLRNLPVNRADFLGFRVVLRVAPVSSALSSVHSVL
jgi:formylglycine-generating enzyme required for sulfatase activity